MTRPCLATATAFWVALAAPAHAQQAAGATASAQPGYAPAERITYAALSAAVPGVGQMLQRRWIWGYGHLGLTVALGSIGLYGWWTEAAWAKWTSAVGLTGLAAYSAFDAYFATPPEPPRPRR